MAQVFADDDRVARMGFIRPMQIPIQQTGHRPAPAPLAEPPSLGVALTPGKGVRRIRCAGCSHDTLPRNADGAPLCPRCSEVLAAADSRLDLLAASTIFRAPRWLRRRPSLS
jgi:hypothetical protein